MIAWQTCLQTVNNGFKIWGLKKLAMLAIVKVFHSLVFKGAMKQPLKRDPLASWNRLRWVRSFKLINHRRTIPPPNLEADLLYLKTKAAPFRQHHHHITPGKNHRGCFQQQHPQRWQKIIHQKWATKNCVRVSILKLIHTILKVEPWIRSGSLLLRNSDCLGIWQSILLSLQKQKTWVQWSQLTRTELAQCLVLPKLNQKQKLWSKTVTPLKEGPWWLQ